MKRIYLTESQIKLLKEESDINQIKLPSFLSQRILKNNTSLGNNDAIPSLEDDMPFLYKITKKRYKEITDDLALSLNIKNANTDIESLNNLLNKLITIVQKKEKLIREQLEKICINCLITLFDIPSDSVVINCNLVDKMDGNITVQVLPESNDLIKYEFQDTKDIKLTNKEVLKRRMIDCLIQGVSYSLSNIHSLYEKEINKLDEELIPLYNQISIIKDYLLFNMEEHIDEKHPITNAYVEVTVGNVSISPTISSTAIIFPFLLKETIRGFMELFASHGLPEDIGKANFILKQADFMLAEPFDLRIGIELWNMLFENYDIKVIPYFFTNLCELNVKNFNYFLQNVFSNTKKGKILKNKLIKKSKHEFEYNRFQSDLISKKKINAVISDGYFNDNDLDNLQINEDS